MRRVFWGVLGAAALVAGATAADTGYPRIPEPMVFDMMRPLGASRGELEVNTLAQQTLSGLHRTIEWAPEIEYAFADGSAIEFEFPFEGGRLAEYKFGLQTAFGASADRKTAHGVQYLGVYERKGRNYVSTLAYMVGHRFSDRVSTMTMAGVGDLGRRGLGRSAVILNHSTFFDARPGTVMGLEINYRSGDEAGLLLMPQLHQKLGAGVNIQAGIGAIKSRDDGVFRPHAALRLIREF